MQRIYVKGKEHYIIELVDYFDYVKNKKENLIDKDTFYYLNKEEVAIFDDIVLAKGKWCKWEVIDAIYEGMNVDEYYVKKYPVDKTQEESIDEMQGESACPNDSLLLDNLLSDIVSNLDEYFKNISIKMEV